MTDHGVYRRLGGTIDDAAGEAFDKVGRMLGLSYPGGPAIQKVARKGDPEAFRFPRAWLDESYDFSFSGLKTAVLRQINRLEGQPGALPVADLAASFQEAVVDVLTTKTARAAEEFDVTGVIVSGGVSANQALRESVEAKIDRPVYIPPLELCTDNAAMIAACGYWRYQAGQRDGYDMDVDPSLPLV
jgi:N6-L-threonylcarbamoyladenine synthase